MLVFSEHFTPGDYYISLDFRTEDCHPINRWYHKERGEVLCVFNANHDPSTMCVINTDGTLNSSVLPCIKTFSFTKLKHKMKVIIVEICIHAE